MEKHNKNSENQDLNDFLLETLAWINYRQRWLIPNNKELSLFSKICCFRKSCFIGKLLQRSSLWISKKIWGFGKNWSLELRITDNSFYIFAIAYIFLL